MVCDFDRWILMCFVCFCVSRFIACDNNYADWWRWKNAIVKVAFELQGSNVLKSPVKNDGKSIVNTGCSRFRVNFSPSLHQIFLCFLFSSTFTFYCQEVLDAHGCELRCSVMSDASQENQFIVARKEVSLLLFFRTLWKWYVLKECQVHAANQ